MCSKYCEYRCQNWRIPLYSAGVPDGPRAVDVPHERELDLQLSEAVAGPGGGRGAQHRPHTHPRRGHRARRGLR